MLKGDNLIEMFIISGVLGIFSEIFGDIQITYFILLILLIIDTLTGMALAVKNKRFNSKGLLKLAKKVTTYTTSIITVRLLEIGIISLYKTTLLSQMTVAFLTVVEAVSILENLTNLDVPIPANIIGELVNYLKIPGLDKAISTGKIAEKDISEIEDIIKYQIPTFNDKHVKKLLEIKFAVWKNIVKQLNNILGENVRNNNEHIYYKIMSLVELGFREMESQWKEENIPRELIDEFNKGHQQKIEKWLQKVYSICFSDDSIQNKKGQLFESIIVILYQTILDAHKQLEKSVISDIL